MKMVGAKGGEAGSNVLLWPEMEGTRQGRGRRALPAIPARHQQRISICLVTTSPMLVEWVRAAAAKTSTGEVAVMPTIGRMRRWLRPHKDCRVLMVENAGAVWAVDLAGFTAAMRLEKPTVAALTAVLRNIFCQVAELPQDAGEIAA